MAKAKAIFSGLGLDLLMTLTLPVTWELTFSDDPATRVERGVILNDELLDGRVILADQLPLDLCEPRLAFRQLYLHRRVRNRYNTEQ